MVFSCNLCHFTAECIMVRFLSYKCNIDREDPMSNAFKNKTNSPRGTGWIVWGCWWWEGTQWRCRSWPGAGPRGTWSTQSSSCSTSNTGPDEGNKTCYFLSWQNIYHLKAVVRLGLYSSSTYGKNLRKGKLP